ncbi:hypothetical protein DFH11DRAFT_1604770 [Phellopilus nigrolimitatus]|nr:hypothetical protein DFH11DRAFT_1604770 [Phellopilus nigrolimitatus]
MSRDSDFRLEYNPFKELRINKDLKDITETDVRKAYLSMSKEFHPDRNGGSTERFQTVRVFSEHISHSLLLLLKHFISFNSYVSTARILRGASRTGLAILEGRSGRQGAGLLRKLRPLQGMPPPSAPRCFLWSGSARPTSEDTCRSPNYSDVLHIQSQRAELREKIVRAVRAKRLKIGEETIVARLKVLLLLLGGTRPQCPNPVVVTTPHIQVLHVLM